MNKTTIMPQDIVNMERHLRLVEPNFVQTVLRHCSEQRHFNRTNAKGHFKEMKESKARETGMIPMSLYMDPRFKHIFDPTLPADVYKANIRKVYSEFSKLKTVDEN